MSLGLGIFLSSLFLGIIFLFVSTKDRWKWKKILFIWPLCFVLVVGVIGGTWFYIYNYYENKPKTSIYEAYLNIPLNASEAELIFLQGDEYKTKRYSEDNNNIHYLYITEDKNGINVRIKENKIWRISCYETTSYSCSSLNEIQIHDSANEVKEKLGEPSYVSISDDNTERVWAYEKFNIYMMLSKGQVDGIGIFEPILGIPKINDDKYDFTDYKNYEFSSSENKLSIKGMPLSEDEEDASKNNKLLLEIISNSSDGDEVVWSEYIALKEERKGAGARLKALAEKQEAAKKKSIIRLATPEEIASIVRVEADKWQKLKKGMATYQVEKLLGKPVRNEGGFPNSYLNWYYSDNRKEGPYVIFSENYSISVFEVSSWKSP